VSHIAKRGLLGDKRDRVEFGTIETHLGTVNVSHDQGADVCRLCHAAGASVAAPACSRPSVPQD
jgi:hypothetical protein